MDTFVEGMVVGKRRWIERLCLLEVAAEVAPVQPDPDIVFEFTPDCIATKRLAPWLSAFKELP